MAHSSFGVEVLKKKKRNLRAQYREVSLSRQSPLLTLGLESFEKCCSCAKLKKLNCVCEQMCLILGTSGAA